VERKAGFQVRLERVGAGFSRAHERRSFLPPRSDAAYLARPLVNPRFTQIEAVLFSLFLGLESTTIGFDSFDFDRLIQVAIKNQSS
jgi:hypothetical protein